jgi:hypothetical protein
MSSLITCSNVHGISPSCLIQVVLVIRSSVWIVSLLHSRYDSFLSAVKCHHDASSLEWYFDSGIVPYPKRIVKALEAMKHQKGMKKGFSLGMSEVDHKATLWVRDLS